MKTNPEKTLNDIERQLAWIQAAIDFVKLFKRNPARYAFVKEWRSNLSKITRDFAPFKR